MPSVLQGAAVAGLFCSEERALSEEIIRQILDIERQAQDIHDEAQREAARIVEQAQRDADLSRRRAEEEAREEARGLLDEARRGAQQEGERILSRKREELRRIEEQAHSHMDEAIRYVLDGVAGRE
jgi:vacuolar-type H+-ATPase subunit H